MAITLSQVLGSIEEPLGLVLPDIEDDAGTIAFDSQHTKLLSVLRRDAASEVGPRLLYGSELDGTLEGHLQGGHLLLSGEQGAPEHDVLVSA